MSPIKKQRQKIGSDVAAYFAGFFDGEGSICVFARRRVNCLAYTVCLQLAQVDPRPLVPFFESYGGALKQYRNDHSFLNSQRIWKWRVEGRAVTWALEDMIPFLILKKDKAEQALAVRKLLKNGGTANRYSDSERAAISDVVVSFRK